MTDLSVALVAASHSNIFDVPVQYGRDKSDDFISKFNRDRTNILTYGSNAARHAVRVHSAIATILVSQPSDEVTAVGAASSPVDERPQQGGDASSELEFPSDKVIDLILCIYLHSVEKVIESIKKGNELGVKGFITEAVDGSAKRGGTEKSRWGLHPSF
ncbi:hypothetical protein ACEPAF_2333 [Sanghuangporus sanghuang]